MTTLRGGPEKYPPDHQQPCKPWLFVLQDEAENYFVPEPKELGLNGSFAVFKKIETDVVGFENYLQSNKDKIDPELLAAKMCGRWRNGVPLALSPDTDSPPGGLTPEQLNNFEYGNQENRAAWRQCSALSKSLSTTTIGTSARIVGSAGINTAAAKV
jgi:hypothetical protein